MKYILLLYYALSLIPGFSFSQNVGIGTATPQARLHVTDSAVLFSAVNDVPFIAGNPPQEGPGRRFMWYPDKAAFRVGYVSGTQWDKNITGQYSFASGYGSTASGVASTAMGYGTATDGFASTAMGNGTSANGTYSTAMGNGTSANGNFSTAMGNYVSTSGFAGAFVIGDNSTTTVMQSFVANGFRSRFAGGYRLLTNSAANLGVVLVPDATSWSAISDQRLKENFLPVDGEIILNRIALLPLSTWNYKAQALKTSRHYGPMAQDFYAAFGKDSLGYIGCDTLISQQDFLGVNLIAIQALEKRTQKIEQLETENREQQIILLQLRNEIDLLKEQNKLLVELIKNKN
ncbi:MAG: tail fiber domain-containing protein [Chitinophagaceae bacterium]|nr:tail fiber domain-containing protein [Chitinophagaceae bacterium]